MRMAIAFRDSNHADSGGTAVTSIDGTIPATTAAGDLLVAFVGFIGNPDTLFGPTPAGWTDTGLEQSRFHVVSGKIFYRIADSSDANSTVTFTMTSNRAMAVDVRAYSGASTATPFDVTGVGAEGSGSSPAAPSLTTVTAGAMSVVFYSVSSETDTLTTITGPAGYGNEENHPAAAGQSLTTYTADNLLGAPGATGSLTATTSSVVLWNAFQMALRPGPAGRVVRRFNGTDWVPQTVTIL